MKPTAPKLLACTRFVEQCPSTPCSLPAPLHRMLWRAADKRAEGPDPHYRAIMVRRLLSAAVESYLLAIGERHDADIVAQIEREARDGTLSPIPTPAEAEKVRSAVMQARVAEERERELREARAKLAELCHRYAAMGPQNVGVSEVELLAIAAKAAGETLARAAVHAGLRSDHWAIAAWQSTQPEPAAK